jgi:tRNA-dihydrouridine synthase
MNIYAAPLQSYTTVFQRMAHQQIFGGVDKYFTPFFEDNKKGGYAPKLLPEIDSELNHGMPVVPQVLTKEAAFLLQFAQNCKDLNYSEINLNLGCPHPMVTRRGNGSGLLATPLILRDLLQAFFDAQTGIELSVKMRLALNDTMLWPEVVEVLNQFPIKEVIVHARTAKQFYKGEPRWDEFEALAKVIRHPLIGNGDINNLDDMETLKARFPSITTWMVGRGYLANPWLPLQLKGDANVNIGDMKQFRAYFEQFYSLVKEHVTNPDITRNLLHDFWYYPSENIEKGRKWRRSLDKKTSLTKYETMVNELLQRDWAEKFGTVNDPDSFDPADYNMNV